ncbi:hypothetical protein C9374_008360 [Naegleria lovaniensis]|uniref:histidine kinase n=1 Tax=Naegleria lovaniensis TaxID=51637 RepID=A0AA88GEZ1_NAELO|nr:uncharacterized protein C9374_008360 [Naegleria lovaniensis]KAG2378217.1 hypothetical protein C9374_008360 [Naegleria lovaniensis]
MQKRKPEVICAEERNAFRSGFTLFLIRFIILRQHKIMLLPLYIILAIATTKFTKYSVLWSFTPLYYTSALFIVDSVYIFACFGFSELCVTSLLENIIFLVVILLISFSIAIIGIDQKSNVKALENTSIQLKMSLLEKQKFLRSISHEFRSPCLSSLGSVELLRETSLTEYQRDMVETIASADEILLNLIEDILKAAKNEHEKKVGHVEETTKTMKNCQEFSLGYCVKTIGNIIKSYASPFNVSVVVKIDDQLKDMVVRGNLTRIHQILANLLTNAVKASKCGGTVQLICDVELHDKSASAVTTEQTIVFTVIDHGVGIPKDKQHKIFEPFTQLHNVNETVYKGSGLGLNTVLHYVQALRGSIHLHSEINEGTEFAVSLPLEVVNANSSSNDGAKDGVVVKKHLFKQAVVSNPENTTIFNSNAKIIIADDNSVNRKVIGKLIESMGFEYDVASNGRQLLDGFDETRHKLVFTDINMPDINGVDVAKILRSKFKERVKIVALTGDAMFQPPPHLFDVVILKPCQKSVLKSCIDSVSFD